MIEDHVEKIRLKIEKEVKKAAKRFGESFDRDQFLATNGRVLGYQEKIKAIMDRFVEAMNAENLADVKQLIEDEEIKCPVGGSMNWTDVRQFNLMLELRWVR